MAIFFFFSSRRRHTRSKRDWSSDVCSSDLLVGLLAHVRSVLVRPGWICPLAPVVRPQCLVHWHNLTVLPCRQIGRASCRERVRIKVGGVTSQNTTATSIRTQKQQTKTKSIG